MRVRDHPAKVNSRMRERCNGQTSQFGSGFSAKGVLTAFLRVIGWQGPMRGDRLYRLETYQKHQREYVMRRAEQVEGNPEFVTILLM